MLGTWNEDQKFISYIIMGGDIFLNGVHEFWKKEMPWGVPSLALLVNRYLLSLLSGQGFVLLFFFFNIRYFGKSKDDSDK